MFGKRRRRDVLLRQWEREGRQVDYERGEVVVNGSWFPPHVLPRILENYAASLHESHQNEKQLIEALTELRRSAP